MNIFTVSPPPSTDAGVTTGSSAVSGASAEGFAHVLARQQSGQSSGAMPSAQPSSTAPASAGAGAGTVPSDARDVPADAHDAAPGAGAGSVADATGKAGAANDAESSGPASSSPLADMVRDLTARSRAVAASSLERSIAAREATRAGKPDGQTVAELVDRHGGLASSKGTPEELALEQDPALDHLNAAGIAGKKPASERSDATDRQELAEQTAALVVPDIAARTAAAGLRGSNARSVGASEMTGPPAVSGHAATSAASLTPTSAAGPRGRADTLLASRSDGATQAKEAKPLAPDARPLAGQAFEQLFSSTLAGSQDGIQAPAFPGETLAGLNPVSTLTPSITGVTPGLAAPAAIFTGSVPVPVGSPQWAPAFSEQMVQIGTQQGGSIQHAELRLDPPDLGPLRISISMQGEHATATFVSPHASVRAAVEAALPELMQALADAGISLGDTSVGEQDAREFAAEGRRHGAARHGDETGEGQDLVQAAVPSRPRGLVDTFA